MSTFKRSGGPVPRGALAAGAAVWLWGNVAAADERPREAQAEALARQAHQPSEGEPFAQAPVLERAEVVRQVLARNPSLEAARAAWQSALAREPQETALEDPMLSYSIAPLSIVGREQFGQTLELSQQLPFPGKRGLRGEMALAEANAMKEDLDELRLRLALTASNLFDDFFVAHRAMAITDEHVRLLEQLKKSAEAQYVSGRASQQDALQAEVELSDVLREKVALESERERLRAQLNGLLHRPPQAPLPPPPDDLAVPAEEPGPSETLQELALGQRPELDGLRARLGGREAAVRLAQRDYYPDLRVMGSYNSMWMDTSHQFMAGVSINVPLNLSRRRAAVREAEANLQRLRVEERHLINDIRVEVEQARTRLVEALRIVALFRERLVPAARDQVAAARASFESGRGGFPSLIDAERKLRSVELRSQMALADVQRRQAELDRATGQVPGLPTEGASR
ncbi:TolC family protein [Pyxidicoccus sp. MSG2]|uniref:TolC family protein n=1 Tax=Pyxidicoccus sp. MSG2 TaxID=2996790 RepID=UPI002271CCD6|nr:TolC family protein [Pyxidicoccus sp. MSG2]MCY1022193.1 TolC family protein [Pyxidicoccus sp. MSG2]